MHPNSDLISFKRDGIAIYKFGIDRAKTITSIDINSSIEKIGKPNRTKIIPKQMR